MNEMSKTILRKEKRQRVAEGGQIARGSPPSLHAQLVSSLGVYSSP